MSQTHFKDNPFVANWATSTEINLVKLLVLCFFVDFDQQNRVFFSGIGAVTQG